MTAPAGAIVGLYVDLCATVDTGDVVETQSGRRYLVVARREQQRGKHAGRQHLRCLVADPEWTPPIATVIHRIRWYSRAKRNR